MYISIVNKKEITKREEKKMKKALAVLVIMMVALTSVFAATTVTLTNKVDDVASRVTVYYGSSDHPTGEFGAESDDAVDSVKNGIRYFEIKLSGNSSQDDTHSVVITADPFQLVDESGAFISGDTGRRYVNLAVEMKSVVYNYGATTVTLSKKDVQGYDGQVSSVATVVSTYNKYSNIADVPVASGTLSWNYDGNDLVAGNYAAKVTVTVNGK